MTPATDSLPVPLGLWQQFDAMLGRKPACTRCTSATRYPRPEAVARWEDHNGNVSLLCKSCLDTRFDNADDNPDLEPASWAWLTTNHR